MDMQFILMMLPSAAVGAAVFYVLGRNFPKMALKLRAILGTIAGMVIFWILMITFVHPS